MSFVLYSRNTVIRAYFDKYVNKRKGATLKEVAAALGYTTKNISDAVFQRVTVEVVEYIRIGPSTYRSTSDHVPGWDAAAAERVLEDHLSGVYRIDGVMSRAKADKAPRAPYRSSRVTRKGAADWGHLHFWQAILDALYELTAMTRGGARRVEDIKAKLVEHKVPNLDDRLGPSLRSIANLLGWVADIGGNPNRWFLTSEYLRLSPEERELALSEWDDAGNRVTLLVAPAAPTYEESTVLGVVVVTPEEGRVLIAHRFEWQGGPFGAPQGTEVMLEAHLPKEMSAQERLGLFQFVMKLREDLLNLI
jgi:hypothetical protein